LHLRRFAVEPGSVPRDAFSPEYLILALQAKRLSLSRTVSAFSRRNLMRWPYLCLLIFVKYLDLKLSVAIVDSLVLERRLLSKVEPEYNSRDDEGCDRQA
jgi:hypothetical protein